MELMVKTTEGLRPSALQVAVCSTAKEIVEHCKRNCCTFGFSVQYAVNPDTNQAIEVVKKGRLIQRDVKALIASGFTVWGYSWAFATKTIRFNNNILTAQTIDLMGDVSEALRAFGYEGDKSC